MKRKRNIDNITKIAIFTALSVVLYFIPKFPLPFFPNFLEIQFSNLPVLLGGFVLGPIGGSIIVLLRAVIKLPFSSTTFVGEFADLLIGLSVVVPSSIIYKRYRTKKGGFIALIVSSICWIIAGVLTNIFINIPLYEKVIPGGIEAIVDVCSKAIKNITVDNFMQYYILFAVIPFNLVLSVMVNVLTFVTYKRLSVVLRKIFIHDDRKKALVISDSFKGTLSSKEVGKIVSLELLKKGYHSKYLIISDGGEGFLSALKQGHSNLLVCHEKSVDAILRPKNTFYLYDKQTNTAFFELANVVGITDLQENEKNPYDTSTYGLGVLIKKTIERIHPAKIVVGLGGSASNDAGSGMLEALGVRFYHEGNLLEKMCNRKLGLVDEVKTDTFNKLISGISFEILTDVTNPLLGEKGATYVFSRQKGAKETDLPILEANIKHFVAVYEKDKSNLSSFDGTGAAGGVGYAFKAFFNASISSGIDSILTYINFEKYVRDYDIIITGEGKLDSQSFGGKVISGIMKYSPADLRFIVGQSDVNMPNVYAICPIVATKEEAMNNPKKYLKKLVNKEF